MKTQGKQLEASELATVTGGWAFQGQDQAGVEHYQQDGNGYSAYSAYSGSAAYGAGQPTGGPASQGGRAWSCGSSCNRSGGLLSLNIGLPLLPSLSLNIG
jgi:hypothetical protein